MLDHKNPKYFTNIAIEQEDTKKQQNNWIGRDHQIKEFSYFQRLCLSSCCCSSRQQECFWVWTKILPPWIVNKGHGKRDVGVRHYYVFIYFSYKRESSILHFRFSYQKKNIFRLLKFKSSLIFDFFFLLISIKLILALNY